jgi:hypothetical protein
MNDDRWAFPPQPPAWPPAPSTTPPRRSSRVLAAVALFVATGVVAAGIGVGGVLLVRHIQGTQPGTPAPTARPGTSAGAAEARALYQQAVTATGASTGFHYVAVSTGADAQTIVGDAGLTNGRQAITFVSNYGTEQFTLLLVGTTVYFQGNTPALQDQLGVSAATAPNLQKEWVSVVAGDGGAQGPYSVLQPGITSSSQSSQMPLSAQSSAKLTIGGLSAIRISGVVPATPNVPAGTGSLVIAQNSDLPITYTSSVHLVGLRSGCGARLQHHVQRLGDASHRDRASRRGGLVELDDSGTAERLRGRRRARRDAHLDTGANLARGSPQP